MTAWWNSVDVVSVISTVSKWVVAISGVVALVFGLRESTLRSRQAEAEKKGLTKQIEEARSRADDSMAKLQPRTVTPKQQIAFLKSAADKPKGSVTLIPLSGQAEPTGYAHQLADLLTSAGYTTEMGGMMPMGSVVGVGLTVKPGETYPPHTDGLIEAFAAAGIRMDKAHNSLQAENVLGLVVGSKP